MTTNKTNGSNWLSTYGEANVQFVFKVQGLEGHESSELKFSEITRFYLDFYNLSIAIV